MSTEHLPFPRYHDFYITLSSTAAGYTVEARGPGAISIPALPAATFPFERVAASMDSLRQGARLSRQELQTLGGALHAVLFPAGVMRAVARAEGMLAEGEHLRLKLIIRPPQLCALPWEVMYDTEAGRFLALQLTLSITRFIESEMPSAPLAVHPGHGASVPLRLLAASASPADLPALALQGVDALLRSQLGKRAEVIGLSGVTPPLLQDALRQPFQVFHFEGHAMYDAVQQAGVLCLQGEGGRAVYFSGERLAQALAGTSVRLVVLSACETAATSSDLRNTGIAYELMKASNLPATVGMQFPVQDSSAVAFRRGFYGALADQYPLDAAMVEGRKAMFDALGDQAFCSPDWAAPVLFLRPGGGNLFPQMESSKDSTMPSSPSKTSKSGVAIHARQIGSLNTGNQIGNIRINGPAIISQGDNATIHQQGSTSPDEITAAFARLQRVIAEKPASPKRVLAEQAIQGLETEARKGEAANAGTVEEWLTSLLAMLPDIGEVVLQTFLNPIAGVSLVFQKIARKAQEERRK